MIINKKTKLVILLIIFSLLVFSLAGEYLSVNNLKESSQEIIIFHKQNQSLSLFLFITFYLICCSLPLPFIAILTIVAGFLFGNAIGLLITSFSSTFGACLAFLFSRHIGQKWIQKKFEQSDDKLNIETRSNSFWLAISLRFIPGLPFFVANYMLGLTKLSLVKFYFSTQIGTLLSLFVFTNAGKNLHAINEISDIVSTKFILSMLLLALLPLSLNLLTTTTTPKKAQKKDQL